MDSKNTGYGLQQSASDIRDDLGPVDIGLRNYMRGIYTLMSVAMVITGSIAYITSIASFNDDGAMTAFGQLLFDSPLKWVLMLAPLAFVFGMAAGIEKMSARTAEFVLIAFSAVMGLSLASVFIVYTGESVARVFFITAAAFAGLSLYGYTTKRDLSGLGSFMILGVFGILIASIVNIFLASTALQFVISVCGVLAFAGLTAYDTQKLKEMYSANLNDESRGKLVVMGALTLYLDAVNLFIFLLQLFGRRE